MDDKSYNFMTVRLWATEKDDGSGKIVVSIEPEIIPGFGEPGSALERYGKAATKAFKVAALARTEEEKILNRAEIRALCRRLAELQKSGENLPGKLPIRPRKEEFTS